jgi:hypothetical protein
MKRGNSEDHVFQMGFGSEVTLLTNIAIGCGSDLSDLQSGGLDSNQNRCGARSRPWTRYVVL